MPHSYIEIANDSRDFTVTNSGITQNFTVRMILDPDIATETIYGELPIEDEEPDYTFLNASDDVVALKYAYTIFPLFRYAPNYDLDKKVLVLSNLKVKQKGSKDWEATAEYKFNVNSGSGGEQPTEEDPDTLPYIRINFNIGGGTKNIKKSDYVIEVDVADGAPLEAGLEGASEAIRGAIGITEDSIDGIDVPDSDLRLQVTVYYRPSAVTIGFMKQIRDVIAGSTNKGSYNDKEFLGCEEGEVQMRGASGGGIVVDIIPITFDFHIGKNLLDEEDEGFSNLTMKAHDVLDYIFLHEWEPEAKRMLLKPAVRVIHSVAAPADYTKLKLPEPEEEA